MELSDFNLLTYASFLADYYLYLVSKVEYCYFICLINLFLSTIAWIKLLTYLLISCAYWLIISYFPFIPIVLSIFIGFPSLAALAIALDRFLAMLIPKVLALLVYNAYYLSLSYSPINLHIVSCVAYAIELVCFNLASDYLRLAICLLSLNRPSSLIAGIANNLIYNKHLRMR